MTVAADMFEAEGFFVGRYAMADGKEGGEEHMLTCDAIILPLPCTFDGRTVFAPLSAETVYLSEIKEISKTKQVFCGKTPQGYDFTDYFDDTLQTMNAAPTAEAAIAIAITHTDRTLMQCKVLVTGGGRVAKALCQRLVALGCKTTVAARKASDRAYFESIYCNVCDICDMSDILPDIDMIFNTVPARIFDAKCIEAFKRGMPLIELASSPYCISPAEAAGYGIELIKSPGLPGRYFCVTAGEAIYKCLKDHLGRL